MTQGNIYEMDFECCLVCVVVQVIDIGHVS